MGRAFYWTIALTAFLCTAANAEPPQLKGRYGYTGWGTCQFASQGFSVTQPPTITPPSPANFADHTRLFAVPPSTATNFSIFNGQGIVTFDGRGHGHHEGASVTVFPSGSVSNTSFDFTYTIDQNGLLRTQLSPNTFKATELNLDGSISGSTWTTDKVNLVGLIGNNGSVITLATDVPEIETQTFLTGPQTGQTSQRICTRSRTLMWLGEGR
jgi:hypothetical protein